LTSAVVAAVVGMMVAVADTTVVDTVIVDTAAAVTDMMTARDDHNRRGRC
jgi:hypothetical protein